MQKCEICTEVPAKYKCPRCLVQTCSLPCVQQHKANTSCTGIRDKTAYVTVKDFTDLNLLSDYRFLEEADRKSDNANRDALKRKRNIPKHAHMLINRCHKRGIIMKILPPGFKRREKNRTYIHYKADTIDWLVEWVFPQAEAKQQSKVFESVVLGDAVSKFLDPGKASDAVRYALRAYHQETQGKIEGIKLLMKVEGRPANSVRYHKLDAEKTLLENLKGKTLVEYPTIHVVLRQHAQAYKLLGEESDQESSDSEPDSSDSDSGSGSDSEESEPSKKKTKVEDSFSPSKNNNCENKIINNNQTDSEQNNVEKETRMECTENEPSKETCKDDFSDNKNCESDTNHEQNDKEIESKKVSANDKEENKRDTQTSDINKSTCKRNSEESVKSESSENKEDSVADNKTDLQHNGDIQT